MNPQGCGNIRGQMVLADERWPGEITHIEGFHLRWANMPIFQAFLAGFHSQGAQIAILKGAERRLSRAGYGHRSHIISLARKSSLHVFPAAPSSTVRAGESPEEILLRSEHRDYLEDGLRLLTARERAALVLRDVEGCSAEEVAKRLDCSKATVRSHIANARIKLRRYMARRKR